MSKITDEERLKRAEYYRRYRKNNPEKIRQIRNRFYHRHKGSQKFKQSVKEVHQRYRIKHREKLKKKSKEYYAANKEEIRRKHREYYHKNKHVRRKYYQENKQKIKKKRFATFETLCRSKIASNKVADEKYNRKIKEKEYITVEWIKAELARQRNKCHYCLRKLKLKQYDNENDKMSQFSVDRKDNSKPHHRSNCVISCVECNYKKHSVMYEDFLRKKRQKPRPYYFNKQIGRPRKEGKLKLDPYKQTIKDKIDMGVPLRKIARDHKVAIRTLYKFVKRYNLKEIKKRDELH